MFPLEHKVKDIVLEEVSEILEEHGGVSAVDVAMVACDGHLHGGAISVCMYICMSMCVCMHM